VRRRCNDKRCDRDDRDGWVLEQSVPHAVLALSILDYHQQLSFLHVPAESHSVRHYLHAFLAQLLIAAEPLAQHAQLLLILLVHLPLALPLVFALLELLNPAVQLPGALLG
jgi:hypothetical protein